MRTISANIATQIAGAIATPRTLYVLNIKDKSTGATQVLRLTNHHANLTFQSQVYSSYRVKHSNIKTYLANQVDNVTVTIDNIDRGMSSYFAYYDFSGQQAEIYKVFLDANGSIIDTGPTDKIVQFVGSMDTPKVSEEQISVRIVNAFDRSQSYSPWRRFTSKCNWDFCGSDCLYNSGNGKQRGTATSGSTTTLGDSTLGSFPFNYWKGASLKILSGANKGEVRRIALYQHTFKLFMVEGSFPVEIDTTSKYIVECDKSQSTCKEFPTSNRANFGGATTPFYKDINTSVVSSPYGLTPYGTGLFGGTAAQTMTEYPLPDKAIPIAYGIVALNGVWIESDEPNGDIAAGGVARFYAICEGEIDSIISCQINGIERSYTSFLGGTTQTLPHYQNKYLNYRRTAVAKTGFYKYNDVWNSSDKNNEKVIFTAKGLKVQHYDANGSTSGQPFQWSNNPAWCILDFLINRSSKPIKSWPGNLTDWIDFASFYNMAAVCTANSFELNLALKEQKKDNEILDLMLAACRGYFTYFNGKMQLNIEQAWEGAVAHSFDDATSGKTNDNIEEGSFNYYEKDVNDVPNKIVVKYLDQEIRENMALTTATITAGTPITSIGYSDIQGSFAAGIMYIGKESFNVTAVGGSSLTISSWTPAKTYPSGYPLFQGAQTFPEMTAIYNDYDSQDKNKRTIEKEIDGSAVPTYTQAYSLAEWWGRKAVEGNLYSNFNGMMDSLHLTVGDVVKVTHALPGWVDAEFRVTEASESEDEEVDYTFELYDSSFYVGSEHVPGVNLATTLPNPFAVPGHVTGLSLSEDGYTNTDGFYTPTLTLTYALPSGDSAIFWDRAKIQISTNGGANYRDYGYDSSRGVEFKIDAVTGGFKIGDTVTVRVISISANNISADASTAPTVSNLIDGGDPPDAITGLRLEGASNPHSTIWEGLKFSIIWNAGNQTAKTLTSEQKRRGAGTTKDPYWKYDEVEIWISEKLVYTIHTTALRFDYIYGDGQDDFLDALLIAATGTVTITARRWDSYNNVSDDRSITITQTPPANPANLSGVGTIQGASFAWEANSEADLDRYMVRTKLATEAWSSWSDVTANSYTRELNTDELATFGGAVIVYVEVKAVDIYGLESASTSTNVIARWINAEDFDNTPPATPTGLALATGSSQGADGSDYSWIRATWDANTESDLAYYEYRIKETGGNYIYGYVGLNEKLFAPVRSNILCYVGINAVDKTGNKSNWTADISTTSAKDTVAPAAGTGLAATAAFKTIFLTWANPADKDLSYIEVWRADTNDRAGATLIAQCGGTDYSDNIGTYGLTKYYWIRAVDDSGNISAWHPTSATAGISATTGTVAATDITNFAISASKIFTKIPILENDSWTDNTPSAGFVSWNAHNLYYNGAVYSIASGNTDLKYIYWLGGTTYSASDTNPVLTDAQFIIATNVSGAHDLAWNAIANQVIGSAFIQDAAIVNAKIANLAVDNAKINDLNATKINAGDIASARLQVNSATAINAGSVKINPGQILVSGSTTLSDWRHGSDNTKINGGNIYANSILANKLEIGSRGLSVQGIEISANSPVANRMDWTAGVISYIKDDNTTADVSISSGNAAWSSGTLYLYWVKDGTALSTTTTRDTAFGSNNVVLASYRGGTDIVVNYGRTIVDGSDIVTGTITADRLNVTTLSSIQANVGTLTGGIIQNATGTNYWNLTTGAVVLSGSITITSGSGYANLSDKPTSLSGINGTEGAKLSGIATGATANSTDAALRDRATHSGTQGASSLDTTVISGGKIVTGLLTADNIQAGTIRGIGVYGSTHATKGSYLTASAGSGASTLNVKDTTDFPSSGSGWILDSANDRDAFSWTGKTATTLTGCTGVLAHTVSASNVPVVVPQIKAMVIADVVNEMRFYGDRGDGNISELGAIGRGYVVDDHYVIKLGGSNVTTNLLYVDSNNSYGSIQGRKYSAGGSGSNGGCAIQGVYGYGLSYLLISNGAGVIGTTTIAGSYGVYGYSTVADGYGGKFGVGSSVSGAPIVLSPSGSASAPTHVAQIGSLWVTSGGVLYINIDGSTTWQKVGAQ